jgi:hypothetical protein
VLGQVIDDQVDELDLVWSDATLSASRVAILSRYVSRFCRDTSQALDLQPVVDRSGRAGAELLQTIRSSARSSSPPTTTGTASLLAIHTHV